MSTLFCSSSTRIFEHKVTFKAKMKLADALLVTLIFVVGVTSSSIHPRRREIDEQIEMTISITAQAFEKANLVMTCWMCCNYKLNAHVCTECLCPPKIKLLNQNWRKLALGQGFVASFVQYFLGIESYIIKMFFVNLSKTFHT